MEVWTLFSPLISLIVIPVITRYLKQIKKENNRFQADRIAIDEADGFSTRDGAGGIDKTLNVLDEDGVTVHQLVFKKGLLTSST